MNELRHESDRLHAAVQQEIQSGGPTSARFDELACRIARFQISSQPNLARLYRQNQLAPADLLSSDQILALPSELFALTRIASHPETDDRCVFRTSGTSQGAGRRGEHAFRRTDTYSCAAQTWADTLLFSTRKPKRAILLLPHVETLPDSSLSHMVSEFCERRGLDMRVVATPDRGIDPRAAMAALEEASHGVPTAVFGTAFAFVMLLDACEDRRFELATGSVAMMTGGFKGRSRIVDETALRQDVVQLLGLREADLISEYGMTELTSQLYEPRSIEPECAAGRYRPPPWLRVTATDPHTLQALATNTQGIARFVDLGNVDSSVAVQTEDRIVVHDNGDITLFGRQPGAPLRGCSLAVEDFLTSDA